MLGDRGHLRAMRLLHLSAAPQPAPPPRQELGPALVVQRIMKSLVGFPWWDRPLADGQLYEAETPEANTQC
jgi:hypothetical protein